MTTDEIIQVEPRLKEILYRCMERVRSTKAALYLADDANVFRRVSHYGFPDTYRTQLTQRDPVIERLSTRRSPFVVNGQTTEPRFSDLMYVINTERMLIAPIHSRGRLIGFIDMRDKAGKKDFDQVDLVQARSIVDDIVELLTQKNLFGFRPITLANASSLRDEDIEVPASIQRIIEQAQLSINRDILRFRTHAQTLSQSDIESSKYVLPMMLTLPGALVAAFSAFGHLGNLQTVAAQTTMTEEAMSHIEAKLGAWMRKRGELEQSCRSDLFYPHEPSGPPITPARLTTILSAPVAVTGVRGLVLTIGFDTPPDAAAKRQLEAYLHLLERTVTFSMSYSKLRATNQKIVEYLLEPDFARYPELVEHSKRVSNLADQFAHHLGMTAGEIDVIRLAALVHDIGMRLLDYQRMYRKAVFTTGDLNLLREHTIVGAVIVEPLLGTEIANIVLTHHERPDGKGYPHGVAGDQIPLGARIIQICDAFDAMTAPESYQEPITEKEALDRILRAGGAHFDLTLATRFVEMMQ
ncbi:MAG TPA: HD domain-containing phosphohydrolase [Thermoanaerobaculia bacterium]